MELLFLLLGIGALIAGAELLVGGAARIAASIGISPLVVGLTVVSFGTSAPELAVTIGSAVTGRPDVAVGNVVGSNILNVFLIIGLAAVFRPMVVDHGLVRREVPFLIFISGLVGILAMDGGLGRTEGFFLVAGAVAYVTVLIREGRKIGRPLAAPSDPTALFAPNLSPESVVTASVVPEAMQVADEPIELQGKSRGGTGANEEDPTPGAIAMVRDVVSIFFGLGFLVFGADWLVESAVTVATAMGVSQVVIGLTVVALGTSLPEVATSVLASVRGQRDIAVGNVVGSNLFNLLLVLGAGALITPGGIPVPASVLAFDIPVMIAAAVACLPVFFTGYRIARWEGWLFLGYYVAYTLYLILAASRHDALDEFSAVMMYFVLPVTVLTLLLLAWETLRTQTLSPEPDS